ncbi:MAG TPA: UDP-2,3-diacylglucosamine diphosphatase [bacterium]|nr:UDP-2,3-diacylglucosamine diphosphatase [bacterium]
MDEAKNRYRSIWISDIHLGTRGCKADYLLDFLKHNKSDFLYLVGDIIDAWQLGRSGYWTQSHNDIIRKFLRLSKDGTRVTYIPGNHDELFRDYVDLQFGGITVADEAIHETADGRRFLVLHGDQFDAVVVHMRWVAMLGDWAYTQALRLNHWFNWVRRKLGYPYWSLSAYLKHKVKNAVGFISRFEEAVAEAALTRNVDGVICGHIHKAEMRTIHGLLYCNDGDWVESCTALVEHKSGELEIVQWARTQGQARQIRAA